MKFKNILFSLLFLNATGFALAPESCWKKGAGRSSVVDGSFDITIDASAMSVEELVQALEPFSYAHRFQNSFPSGSGSELRFRMQANCDGKAEPRADCMEKANKDIEEFSKGDGVTFACTIQFIKHPAGSGSNRPLK